MVKLNHKQINSKNNWVTSLTRNRVRIYSCEPAFRYSTRHLLYPTLKALQLTSLDCFLVLWGKTNRWQCCKNFQHEKPFANYPLLEAANISIK